MITNCARVCVREDLSVRKIHCRRRTFDDDRRREGKLQNKKEKKIDQRRTNRMQTTMKVSWRVLISPIQLLSFLIERHCEGSSNFGSAASFITKLLWHSELERDQSCMALERSEVELMKSFNWLARQQREGKVECSRWRWTAESALEIDRERVCWRI